MMHPSSNVDREYACRVRGEATPEQLQRLKDGVELEDGPAAFSDIQPAGGSGENHWYHATIMEGRNREVRRMVAALGHEVLRLVRTAIGDLRDRDLEPGSWRHLDPPEVRRLYAIGAGNDSGIAWDNAADE